MIKQLDKLKCNYHIIILQRILIAYLLFTLTRVAFFVFNYSLFKELSIIDLFLILFYGLRFDTVAIFLGNSLFILLSIIPFRFRIYLWYQNILKYFFIVINSVLIAANCIDIIYYKFTQKRTTYDFFGFVSDDKDTISLIPRFLLDFWYILLLWSLLIFLMIFLYNKTRVGHNCFEQKKDKKYYFIQIALTFLYILIAIIGMRGGTQYKPISIINAADYSEIQYVPLVLNTPFTIFKTYNKQSIIEAHYYKDLVKAEKIFNPIHLGKTAGLDESKKKNVVLIIFEGLSKEHIGCLNKNLENGNYRGFTPFLDSIIKKSLVFENAFANGKKSIEGIPAIISGIPTLMNTPYISSMFAGNKINSIPSLLKEKGYTTSFYHGGKNGTMHFDSYCKLAGIDNYYGKSEYNNDADFDGNWGIWDEEFLQYSAQNINKGKQPFFASIFTLSSHHPYSVPEKYKGKFPKGKLKIQESIAYADFALKRFFLTASKMAWYNNSLFVITADHTSESFNEKYLTRVGMYQIPIIFFEPKSNLKGSNHTICQQTDIMPTILNYLNYDKKFIAYGQDILDSNANHINFSFLNDTYQLIEGDYSLIFDGNNSISLYNWKSDPLLKKNVLKEKIDITERMERLIKAIIQSYNERLLKNKLTIN